ncbi:MAG: DUF190 domain-containing protein [Acetobacteraceae bacterium]
MGEEMLVARIYINESDHGRRKSLMQEMLNVLHEQQRVLSVVVFRGIAGIGDSGEVHAADILRLNVDLPLVVEFFDRADVVKAALALLEPLLPAGHPILCWTATQYGKPSGR